jgi:hypothetical protein
MAWATPRPIISSMAGNTARWIAFKEFTLPQWTFLIAGMVRKFYDNIFS